MVGTLEGPDWFFDWLCGMDLEAGNATNITAHNKPRRDGMANPGNKGIPLNHPR
jgi:hypothetical protein